MKELTIKIKSCKDCPFLKIGNSYSLDGWDRGEDWSCKKKSNKSKICKVLKAWGKLKDLPKQLDLKKYHGKWCEIKIEHKPNRTDPEIIYANIYDGGRGIDALSDEQKAIIPKLQTVPGLNKNIWLDFDNFDWNVYNELPEFIQKKIQKAKEWTAISAGQVGKTANADTTVDENDPDF